MQYIKIDDDKWIVIDDNDNAKTVYRSREAERMQKIVQHRENIKKELNKTDEEILEEARKVLSYGSLLSEDKLLSEEEKKIDNFLKATISA